jgi:hypothetical protein
MLSMGSKPQPARNKTSVPLTISGPILSLRPDGHTINMMLARVLALALAACTAATGVLPALDGWRCVAMDRVMSAGDDCPRCHTPSQSIGNPCCEAVHVSSLQARANPAPHKVALAPAPPAALLAFALTAPESQLPARTAEAHPRGQPRSTILRI